MKYQCAVTTDEIQGIPLLLIEGDMTSDADVEVKKHYANIKSEYSLDAMIINFEKTKYINSSGIATLINIIQDLNERNGKVFFVGMTDHFEKVMEIVGISDFVQIMKTNEEALSAIKGS